MSNATVTVVLHRRTDIAQPVGAANFLVRLFYPHFCNLFAKTLELPPEYILIATLKPQSNGPSYRNTVIGTLAVDG